MADPITRFDHYARRGGVAVAETAEQTKAPTIHDCCGEILRRREQVLQRRANVILPRYLPRASDIGDCDRELKFAITHWKQRPPISPGLMARFDRGRLLHSAVRRELSEIGLEVVEAEIAQDIRDPDDPNTILCSGHIDGRIRWNGITPVCEIKSLQPHVAARINTADDFNRFQFWARRYPRQLLMYMYVNDEPNGLFLIDNCAGQWKALPMQLEDHLDECEKLLQRLRKVVKAEKAEDLPFCNDPTVCRECWCYQTGLCAPPMDFSADGIHVVSDSELQELFNLIHQYESQAAVYNDAVKRIKDRFKASGEGQYLVGNTLVTTKVSPRKSYDIPADVKAKYAKPGTMTKTTWTILDED